MIQYLIALALFMHGAGHVLFLANAWGYWKTDTGHAWLFTQALQTGQTLEGVLGLLWLVPLAGFVAGTSGFLTHTAGWQPMLLAGAVISTALIFVWWGSINTSSAVFALIFNVIVIAAVLWQQQALPAG